MGSKVIFKFKSLLEEKQMTQKELAKKSNIREATISDIIRGTRTVLNFEHLERIVNALEVRDIRDLIEIQPDDSKSKNNQL